MAPYTGPRSSLTCSLPPGCYHTLCYGAHTWTCVYGCVRARVSTCPCTVLYVWICVWACVWACARTFAWAWAWTFVWTCVMLACVQSVRHRRGDARPAAAACKSSAPSPAQQPGLLSLALASAPPSDGPDSSAVEDISAERSLFFPLKGRASRSVPAAHMAGSWTELEAASLLPSGKKRCLPSKRGTLAVGWKKGACHRKEGRWPSGGKKESAIEKRRCWPSGSFKNSAPAVERHMLQMRRRKKKQRLPWHMPGGKKE